METVNIHFAKTHLSRLIERAESGEEIVIARAGKPAVKLVPVEPGRREPRRLGGMEGLIRLADDFDAPVPDLERLFDGDPPGP
ncbi:MAG TPA: type II toxin-antitoxin system Phd/YefM family antitoxin [Chloroflexota bacterium]|jgi:prevent-host-death family protein